MIPLIPLQKAHFVQRLFADATFANAAAAVFAGALGHCAVEYADAHDWFSYVYVFPFHIAIVFLLLVSVGACFAWSPNRSMRSRNEQYGVLRIENELAAIDRSDSGVVYISTSNHDAVNHNGDKATTVDYTSSVSVTPAFSSRNEGSNTNDMTNAVSTGSHAVLEKRTTTKVQEEHTQATNIQREHSSKKTLKRFDEAPLQSYYGEWRLIFVLYLAGVAH